MTRIKQVYCKNCAYRRCIDSNDFCVATPHFEVDPVHGPNYAIKCRERNKNLDCEYFKKRRKEMWEHDVVLPIILGLLLILCPIVIFFIV